MLKAIIFILFLGFYSINISAFEVFTCELSVNNKLIRTESVMLVNSKNIQLDLGTYSKYHFGGGISGAFKYAWYWYDELESNLLVQNKQISDPAVAVAISETGE